MVNIPELSKKERYNVRLVNIPYADITWSSDIARDKVSDAITELLVMKERSPRDFEGDIVISKASPVLQEDFNGAECEADVISSGSGVVSYLPSSGRDRSGERIHHQCHHAESIHTIGPKKICAWSVKNPSAMPGMGDEACQCEGLED